MSEQQRDPTLRECYRRVLIDLMRHRDRVDAAVMWLEEAVRSAAAKDELEKLRVVARRVCEGATEIEVIAGSGYTVSGFLLQELDTCLPPRIPTEPSDWREKDEC